MPDVSGVYLIRNVVNGRVYVGSSCLVHKRLDAHKSLLNRQKHHNRHLQAAWNKYGASSFSFQLLEETAVALLIQREQYYIDTLLAHEKGYNLSPTAGSTRGFAQPEHVCAAVAAANRRRVWSDAQREHHAEVQAVRLRMLASDPILRERLRRVHAGKVVREETRAKLRAANLGKHHSAEARKKMSEARRGRPMSEEQKQLRREMFKGRVFSDETKRKMRDAAKRRWARVRAGGCGSPARVLEAH